MDVSIGSAFQTSNESSRRKKRRLATDDYSFATSENFDTTDKMEEARSNFFNMVKSGENFDIAIDNWIKIYENHPDNALQQLQQFFISCCGCERMISSFMLQTMRYDEIILQMTEHFVDDAENYPLVMVGPKFSDFKQNFADFITLFDITCQILTLFPKLFVNKGEANYVSDWRIMDAVIKLLTALSNSQVQAFRHTSTFAAMKLLSALIDIAVPQEKNVMQIETRKDESKTKDTSNHLRSSIFNECELVEKSNIYKMVSYLFKNVFVRRYRDFLPEIRNICIIELGKWLKSYPEIFLIDSYLKYIGWLLHDKVVSKIRLSCVTSLLPLYDLPEMAKKLEFFTNKFQKRFVSLVMDKDYEVATFACKLLTGICSLYYNIIIALYYVIILL
ncbi:unnamed protein product [Dracunculus medinensis]|uniref:SCD domain-containing protein n=1 Tax=Dracunculus medinensis TaxID=318479 RepID=A0A0N4U1V1_DRAME|nr:unnamed protein product [Dracunculus medinensis]